MSTDDVRRPFYKRPPMVAKTPTPRPYTTLNQPAGERLSRQSADVNLKPLDAEQPKLSDLSARLVSEGLSDLAKQINSSEYQAHLAQNAAELAHASETSSQLKKALEELRSKEIGSLDAQITSELEKQGITKAELQRNPRLRASVTKWKRDIYASVNKGLASSEAQNIAETQKSLTEAQKESRAGLSKDIVEWRASIAPVVEEAITSNRLQKAVDNLANRGIVNVSGDKISLSKPLHSLSRDEIRELGSVGFEISNEEADKAVATGELVKRGVITVDNDQMSVRKSVADLTASEIRDLNSLGFSVSESDVNNQRSINNLVSQGVISKNNDVLSLNKPVASLSSGEVEQLSKLGFSISDKDVEEAKMYAMGSQIPTLPKLSQQQVYTATGTTKFTAEQIASQNIKFKEALASGKITAEQYNQAVAQQNANLNAVTAEHKATVDSLISSGTLKKTVTGRAGGLQSAYAITKPLASISDAELSKLEKVGFTITPEMRTQRVETQNLIKDKVVRIENNQLKLLKPVSALSDADISHLKNVGFSVPDAPKGPSAYLYEAAKSQGYQGAGKPITPNPFGYTLRNISAVVGDVFQTVTLPLLPYQLAMSLVPGEQPLESGFRGPTSSSLSYYEDVSPSRQVGLTALGALASYSTGALASVPIGFASKATVSVAKNFTSKLVTTLPKSLMIGTTPLNSVALSIKRIAANLRISNNTAIKVLSTKDATQSQVNNAMAALFKNPKFGQAILWSTMAGMNAVDVYSQIARGDSVDKIIERTAVSLSGQLGGYQGFTKGYKIADVYIDKIAKLVSATKNRVFLAPDGSVITPYSKLSQIPESLRGSYKFLADASTGKIKVIGVIENKSVVPMSKVFKGAFEGKPSFASTDRLLNNLELAKNSGDKLVSQAAVKNIIQSTVGTDGYQTLINVVKGGEKKLLSMSAKQIADEMEKVFGYGGPVHQSFENVLKGKGLLTDGKGGKLYSIPSMNNLYDDLVNAGFSKDDALYWSGKLLSEPIESVVKTAKDVWKMGDGQIQYLAKAGLSSGATKDYQKILSIIEKNNLNKTQAKDVMRSLLTESDTPKGLANSLVDADTKVFGTLVELLPEESVIRATKYMEPPDISSLLTKVNASSATQILAVLDSKKLIATLNTLTPRDIQKLSPYLKDSQISEMLSSLRRDALNATLSGIYLLGKSKDDTLQLQVADEKTGKISTPPSDRINSIVTGLTVAQIAGLTPNLNVESLRIMAPSLSASQWVAILSNAGASSTLTPGEISDVLINIATDTNLLNNILTELQVTPEEMVEYLRTNRIPSKTIEATKVSPIVIKRLLNSRLKQTKSATTDHKTRMFDVTLQYPSSSAHFKVKSNSFHGASRDALLRRGTAQIPVNVVVKPLREQ